MQKPSPGQSPPVLNAELDRFRGPSHVLPDLKMCCTRIVPFRNAELKGILALSNAIEKTKQLVVYEKEPQAPHIRTKLGRYQRVNSSEKLCLKSFLAIVPQKPNATLIPDIL